MKTKTTPSFAPTSMFLYDGLRAFNDLFSFNNVEYNVSWGETRRVFLYLFTNHLFRQNSFMQGG